MHYVGKLRSNKKVFDSSIKRGTPIQFQIGVGMVRPAAAARARCAHALTRVQGAQLDGCGQRVRALTGAVSPRLSEGRAAPGDAGDPRVGRGRDAGCLSAPARPLFFALRPATVCH